MTSIGLPRIGSGDPSAGIRHLFDISPLLLHKSDLMLGGSCHCGAVKIEVPGAPEWVGSCNCSLCRKTGTLMAYYPDDGSVRVEGETAAYMWGDRMIHQHCPVCACMTGWVSTGESYGKVGVNARLLDGFSVSEGRVLFDGREVEVRFLDNAGSR